METKKRLYLCFLLLLCASCVNARSPGPSGISVGDLVSSTSELDGKQVVVQGWIEIEPETFRLWGTDEAMGKGLDDSQCVGITLPKGLDRKKLDRSRVVVSGRYVADISGRFIVLGGCRSRRFIFIERIDPLG